MSRVAVEPSALTAVAVAVGPGSYTGLRIGMALAKGLSLSYNLPVVGIPTLDILASPQPPREGPMLAVMQAGRGRVAGGWYKWSRKGWSARGTNGAARVGPLERARSISNGKRSWLS